MLRGDVYRFLVPKGTGHEQRGNRYGVLVQANELLPRSVVLMAPTSLSARPASTVPRSKYAESRPEFLSSRWRPSTLLALASWKVIWGRRNSGVWTRRSRPSLDFGDAHGDAGRMNRTPWWRLSPMRP